MLRSRSLSLLAAVAALLAPAALLAADVAAVAPAPEAGRVEPVPAPSAPAVREFAYGPILSHDPVIRGQIKKLYRDQWDYNVQADAQIAGMKHQLDTETDADVRSAISQDALALKKEIQVQNVQFGLEIARLNEDAERVAEFERALDQLLRPEQYLPTPVDPSIAEQRARDLGLK